MIVTKIFARIDDFMKVYEPMMHKQMLTEGSKKRQRATKLTLSEIMTIVVYFQISGYRNANSKIKSPILKSSAIF